MNNNISLTPMDIVYFYTSTMILYVKWSQFYRHTHTRFDLDSSLSQIADTH